MKLNLTRPLVFFDLETTGVNVGTDKIVEISMLKVMPDNSTILRTELINPGIHIPAEVSKIHGIFDKDVADKPYFEKVAPSISDFIKGCDLAGYNLMKFDIPLLVEEFLRLGLDFDLRGIHIIDVQNIFHRMEQRNLRAAYKFYCHESLENAHTAEADTIATYKILESQLDFYKETPYVDENEMETFPIKNNVSDLSTFSTANRNVDLMGHIVFDEKDREIFNFGKHKGKTLEHVFSVEPNYYDWMMKADFPLYTKKIIHSIRLRMLGSKLSGK
jgi:DNA polymerase-3 subunit epsilon